MFIQYVERSIYNVQLEKLDWKFVCSFYFELDCKNIALMVYDGDEYYTNITYEEISRYSEEKEWIYFYVNAGYRSLFCKDHRFEVAVYDTARAFELF